MILKIKKTKDHIPYQFLCDYFGVSRSSFFEWKKHRETELPSFTKKAKILELIPKFFKESSGSYGSPRILSDLKDVGITVSENTVAKYMVELGLDARQKKKYRVMTTDSNHANPIAPRLFRTEDEHCLPTKPGEVLAGDITYLTLSKHRHVYLAVVMDLYNREIVGWSVSDNMETSLVLRALENAMGRTSPDVQVIFHSDRGSQYASDAYRNFLKNQKVLPSMSRKGNCYDNAYVESWFSSLKKEWIYRHDFSTEEEVRSLVFKYIETWYNTKRKHSALDYMSPVQYKNFNSRSH